MFRRRSGRRGACPAEARRGERGGGRGAEIARVCDRGPCVAGGGQGGSGGTGREREATRQHRGERGAKSVGYENS